MSIHKEHVFRDFRVIADSKSPRPEDRRKMNVALFATYYPLTLWLGVRRMKTPFMAFQVLLSDACVPNPLPPFIGHCEGGTCVVQEPVDYVVLREQAGNPRWVVDIVKISLGRVAEKRGWRSPEFEAVLEEFAGTRWPAIHFFEKLRANERRSGLSCVPWMSFQPALTKIGIRISQPGKPNRDVEVLSKNDPLWYEDDFPMRKSKIQSGHFLLLDKDGNPLASVPLDPSSLH